MTRWVLAVLWVGGSVAWARWVYRRLDLPVREARWLWPLRAAALSLVLLLLLDPRVPWAEGSGPAARWVLLDASLSMNATDAGESPWTRASERAAALRADGWRVVTFGVRTGGFEDSLSVQAEQPGTRLAPALALAAESGAQEIRVLSDLRIEDEVAVRGILAALPAEVAFERMGGAVPNAGVARLEVGDRPIGSDPGEATVEVFGGAAGETLFVEVFEEGRPVGRAEVPAVEPGLTRGVRVALPPSSGAGEVRYEARIAGATDLFGPDDRDVDYARVGAPEGGGIVLLSLAADWEPRALLPVLERTTGLTGTGYLRVGPDRFVPIGRAVDLGVTADSQSVRRAAEDASLLVLHGLHGEVGAWARGLVAGGGRRLIFVTDVSGAGLVGLRTSEPRPGEWYAVPDLPPSPIGGALAGAVSEDLPPLTGTLVPADGGGLAPAVLARFRRNGPAEPVLLLRSEGGTRDVLVLARGFWRWSARQEGKEAYERLWSAVAGWLLAEPVRSTGEIRPVRLVVPRGERVDWRVPPDRTGYRVRVLGEDGVGADTTFASEGVTAMGPLAPGHYRYALYDAEGDSVDAGRFDVSEGTTDLLPAVADPARLASGRVPGAGRPGSGGPLRTSPWPYLSIIGLLCLEWVGRRRAGLR